MPLKIIREDITRIKCDAIVNPTNRHLTPGGGADLAIHMAAGEELTEFCKSVGGCRVGKAILSPGFNLPCKYVIHTAGPNYNIEKDNEALLISCYTECMRLAIENKCKSIAFPLIAAGTYCFPRDKVLKIATSVLTDFLLKHDILIYLVVYDKESYSISERLFSDITAYIDDSYVEEDDLCFGICSQCAEEYIGRRPRVSQAHPIIKSSVHPSDTLYKSSTIDDMLKNMDKTFAETLFYYIDKKGVSDIDCYKRSNVDKKVFSKIKCNKGYKPSKITALSFAIGLRLDLKETEHLLKTAGMSLSHSNKLDVIVEYFIKTGNYKNIFEVNEVLYKLTDETLCV